MALFTLTRTLNSLSIRSMCDPLFPTMRPLLELYKYTNQQVAALNNWDTSWPVNIAISLLSPLSHLAAGTTLHQWSLSQLLVESSLISIACRTITFDWFFCSRFYHSNRVICFSLHCFFNLFELIVLNLIYF